MSIIKVDIYDLIDARKFSKTMDSCSSCHQVYAEDDNIPDYHCSRNSESYQNNKNNHSGCVDCSPENCSPEILRMSLRNGGDLRRYFTGKYESAIKKRKNNIEIKKMLLKSEEKSVESLEGVLKSVPTARFNLTSGAKKVLKIAKSGD